MQAWLNQAVQATTDGKNPKPLYPSFDKFFNYEKEVRRVEKLYKPNPISNEKVTNFKRSVAEAERLLNGGR